MENLFHHSTRPEKEEDAGSRKLLGYFNTDQENAETKKDAFLWKAFISGSREAFSDVFLKYNPKLITIGIKLGFERKTVEDCIQDLFLNLWLKRQHLSEVNSVKYYLIVSLRRSLLHNKEKAVRVSKLIDGIRLEYPSIELPALWDDKLNERRTEFLFKSMELLPKRQVLALKLRYVEEKTYPEIASIMAVDINSVRKFVCKAIKKLKSVSLPLLILTLSNLF
jgi:RNA polymerase sigma factor (sigma-70 family)